MDLMIEAKDKEQAVFTLRRKWNIEGGLPKEWVLTGEKMDEEREVPSEMGWKVFYEEGEEWRFKPPIKMPARVQKMLDKLEKEKKVEKDGQKVKRIEKEKQNVLAEWEKEKRIKWEIEKKAEGENGMDGVTPISTPKNTPKRTSSRKSTKFVVQNDNEEEWTPPMNTVKKTASRRRTVDTSMNPKSSRKILLVETIPSNGVTNNVETFSKIIETSEIGGENGKRKRTSRTR
jgi:hypothetical protein